MTLDGIGSRGDIGGGRLDQLQLRGILGGEYRLLGARAQVDHVFERLVLELDRTLVLTGRSLDDAVTGGDGTLTNGRRRLDHGYAGVVDPTGATSPAVGGLAFPVWRVPEPVLVGPPPGTTPMITHAADRSLSHPPWRWL